MKFRNSFRVAVLSLLSIAGSNLAAMQLTPENVAHISDMFKQLPAIQLDRLMMSAQNNPQLSNVQDLVFQIVTNAYNAFATLPASDQRSLILAYQQLLNSPLLNQTQKDYIKGTILPAVTALSGTTAAPTTTPSMQVPPMQTDAQQMFNLAQNAQPTNAVPVQLSAPQAVPSTSVNTGASVVQSMPQQAMPVGVATQALSFAAVTSIMSNPQLSVSAKALGLANLIATVTGQVMIDSATSLAIAQAIQDLFNQQGDGDAPAIAQLLQIALAKSVLSQDQAAYVSSTLLPAIQNALPTATGTLPPPPAPAQQLNQAQAVASAQSNQLPGQGVGAGQQPAALSAALTTPPAPQQQQVAAQNSGIVPQPLLVSLQSSQPAAAGQAQAVAIQQAASSISQNVATVASPTTQAATTGNAGQQLMLMPDIKDTIKALYLELQEAQGKTFDNDAQADFGVALVDAYNEVVQIQSFMSQLLNATPNTPLLNAAQKNYVQTVMLPGLDNVTEAVPTKSLDKETKADVAAGKKLKTKKHKKNKKHKKQATAASAPATSATAATAKDAAATTQAAPKKKKQKKNKKHKKQASTAAAATTTTAPATK